MAPLSPTAVVQQILASGRSVACAVYGGSGEVIGEFIREGLRTSALAHLLRTNEKAEFAARLRVNEAEMASCRAARAAAMQAFQLAHTSAPAAPAVGVARIAACDAVYWAVQCTHATTSGCWPVNCDVDEGVGTIGGDDRLLREVLTAAVSERHDSTPLPDAHPTHRIERACGAAPVRELIVNQRQKWQCHPQSELPLGSTSSAPDGRWNRPRELPNPQRQEWQCHTQSELPLGGPSSAPDGRWNRSRELPNPQRQEWPTGESALGDSPKIVFPGAFQPLHSGHRLMAAVAGRRLNETVHYELSVTNVDKAPLDFIEIRDRCRQSVDEPVWLTAAPTFAEKARCFPAATFVVGVDTIVRVGDERYYADATSRSRAFAQIEELGCRFLVFGRRIEHQFRVKSAVDLPPDLARLCDEVSEVDFRQDISSTEIRKRS